MRVVCASVRCGSASERRPWSERRSTTVSDLWSIMTRDHPDLRDPRATGQSGPQPCVLRLGDAGRARRRGGVHASGGRWVDERAMRTPTARGAGRRIPSTSLARSRVRGDGDGAIAAFVGAVRDTNQGRPVHRLDYEAYLPMADRELRRIAIDVTERHGLSALALVHRVGSLAGRRSERGRGRGGAASSGGVCWPARRRWNPSSATCRYGSASITRTAQSG